MTAQFLPQTRVKLNLAIRCNQEIADHYAKVDTDLARRFAVHHLARVETCREKLRRMRREGFCDV